MAPPAPAGLASIAEVSHVKKSIGDNMFPQGWGLDRGLELVKKAGFDGIELWLGANPWLQPATTDAQVADLLETRQERRSGRIERLEHVRLGLPDLFPRPEDPRTGLPQSRTADCDCAAARHRCHPDGGRARHRRSAVQRGLSRARSKACSASPNTLGEPRSASAAKTAAPSSAS